MQPLERAVAIFCIACICAELTTQLAGSTWARRCIKAVAGLYILVVFARTVPQAHVQLRAFLVPVQEPVSIASPETAILAQTQAQLEQTLAEQWCTKTGREASVAVMLKETDSVVAVCSAQMTLPANCTAEERQQAGAFLQEKLQLLPKQIQDRLQRGRKHHEARTFGTEEVAANPAEKAEPCTACIGSGLHGHGAHFAFRVVPGKSPGGTAGCISGGGYLQNTAGAAADRADRAGTGSRKDHCDAHTGKRGGDRLCLGHALGTDPDAADSCAAGRRDRTGTNCLSTDHLRCGGRLRGRRRCPGRLPHAQSW